MATETKTVAMLEAAAGGVRMEARRVTAMGAAQAKARAVATMPEVVAAMQTEIVANQAESGQKADLLSAAEIVRAAVEAEVARAIGAVAAN